MLGPVLNIHAFNLSFSQNLELKTQSWPSSGSFTFGFSLCLENE